MLCASLPLEVPLVVEFSASLPAEEQYIKTSNIKTNSKITFDFVRKKNKTNKNFGLFFMIKLRPKKVVKLLFDCLHALVWWALETQILKKSHQIIY